MERKKWVRNCPLFRGIPEEEMEILLKRIKACTRIYQKDEILLNVGDTVRSFGIVASGELFVMKEEYSGSTAMVAQILSGELFAEAFAAGEACATVTVMAADKTEVLWIDYRAMTETCPDSPAHKILMKNMMQILARKNLFLTGRISHLSRRTLREKVLSYLSEQALKEGKKSFEIPFDRQGLADYLAADRSALSAVLGKLKKEGVLSFRKNQFELLKEEEQIKI
ncbi:MULTISPECIES: Crp/Fnr family transcriptional regulator [Sellimonas]|uniref:Crp/Fnr family transcriptional regulator n=1 Tax=Sellimonas caecigallum TaxID=2592333 RepID=A0ABS7L6Z9_9FIRM|nr:MULTISPECIES: Crp/Fnr family transcriptional regulator [Sellimonas]MBY0758809.1 Crp/Fnr family transcriptional regulator [Sellimonas caecigallum]